MDLSPPGCQLHMHLVSDDTLTQNQALTTRSLPYKCLPPPTHIESARKSELHPSGRQLYVYIITMVPMTRTLTLCQISSMYYPPTSHTHPLTP